MRFLVDDGTYPLAAYLHDPAGLFLRFGDRQSIVNMLHHRLFAIHILLGVESVNRDLLMPVIGRADEHRVNAGPRQDLFVILRHEDIAPVLLLHVGEPPVVAVARGNDFGQAACHRGMRIVLAHAAAADQRNLNLVVGGRGPRLRLRR